MKRLIELPDLFFHGHLLQQRINFTFLVCGQRPVVGLLSRDSGAHILGQYRIQVCCQHKQGSDQDL
ncbi:MAG TPA: hypothetical protein VME23_16810 [Terracidiphilus sp.]|nr:hypothetical protein [Terracidiphilus sp.]